jgi:arabinooligosaccharide transport system permease protein
MTTAVLRSRARPRIVRRLAAWSRRRQVAPYLFIAPFYVLYAAFLLGPTAYAAYLSLHSWDGITDPVWRGLKNYSQLFGDASFIHAAVNTTMYSAAALLILCPLALALALALNARGVRWKDLFRVGYFTPIVVSPLVISIMFVLIFDRSYGLANAVLRGVLGLPPVGWTDTPTGARVAIVLVILWRYTGYVMIFFLAGLQNIPRDLYEAAQVSGATPWQEFRYVTLPMLRPVTAFIAIVVLIGTAQIFEEPFILTQGGPGDATISTAQFVYREGIQNSQLGYASAASVVLFAAIFVVTFALMRLFRVGREYL